MLIFRKVISRMNDRIIRNKKVKKNEIDIITMGCSKNLVDSELLMKQFEANGYHCVHDSKRPQGEIAVINTCGFIEDAKQESIDTILEFVQRISFMASSTTSSCCLSWARLMWYLAMVAVILQPHVIMLI